MITIERASTLRGYRWWTIMAWDEHYGCGFKCGPLSIMRSEYAGRSFVTVCFLGRSIWDPLLSAMRRGEV